MLVAVSQPHFSAYDWKSPDAEQTNGYRELAAFYVRAAQNHPSVVAYSMSHNATSYDEAKNPDLIDGIYDQRDNWSSNNVKQGLRAEAIVKQLDPSRIVYHHSSGNLGSMYTENFYTNFTPKQEIDDWFEHWATKGVKPLFLCEYAVPCTWDWTMYRGWWKGKREWGSANVPWDFSMAEWNAQFHGDRAYNITEQEKANIRWEARQFRDGREGWHRWDYPYAVGAGVFDERLDVLAEYIEDNWRAFRTWGVSAYGPWEHEIFWRLKPGVDRGRKALAVDWSKLQRPGFSADYLDQRYERMDLAYGRSDWAPTSAAKALLRNNMPVLAYIAGKPSAFTSKDHIFRPGGTVEKQLVIVNNSRRKIGASCTWDLGMPAIAGGRANIEVGTGHIAWIPIRFKLPENLKPGHYLLVSNVKPDVGEALPDAFGIDVIAPAAPAPRASIALFDPKGETRILLDRLGYKCSSVGPSDDPGRFELLVIGKGAVTLTNEIPDLRKVRTGLKVIVFEQTAEVLEQRFGFRVAEYGFRQVFPRIPDHPIINGLTADNLRDWAGEATLSTPRLQYTLKPMYGPMVKWCGFDVPRAWRAGCQGNVASVVIEKPARGDFLPILDCGFSLQYSPLMVYREGSGMAVFCQMDVSGRTENDPAASLLASNLLSFAEGWKPEASRKVYYVGDPAGRAHLERSGIEVEMVTPGLLDTLSRRNENSTALLVIGPESEKFGRLAAMARAIDGGCNALAIGQAPTLLRAAFRGRVKARRGEHIATTFNGPKADGWCAGIGSADVYNRDPKEYDLIVEDNDIEGSDIVAFSPTIHAAFCQLVPWQFDTKLMNQKHTFRRTSFLLTRLLCNLGAAASSPLLDDGANPVKDGLAEKRWLHGLYLDTPEEWDDPYRFFGW
jgi:hypothetical protein